MATKKGLCLHCQGKRIDHRIFPVNPEASTCFCPVCMKEMEPKVAIDNYLKLIKDMLFKADNTLFVACDPALAYQQYADVLEFEANDAHALIGRILCLIYMGKVRKSYLKEAYILLENTSYKGCDIEAFTYFLKKIDFALDEYETAVTKKLTFKEHFYDIECLKLYWILLNDVIKFKELIQSIFERIAKTYTTRDDEAFINMLKNDIANQKKILSEDKKTCDGRVYKFTKIVNGRACVEVVNDRANGHFSRYRLSTLDPNEKGKKLIKDEVFKDYTVVIRLKNASTLLLTISYLLSFGAAAGAYFLRDKLLYFIILLVFAGLAFIFASLVVAQSIYFRALLRKRELRIN